MNTFEQFFAENPKQAEIYKSEYEDFLQEEKHLEETQDTSNSSYSNKSFPHCLGKLLCHNYSYCLFFISSATFFTS